MKLVFLGSGAFGLPTLEAVAARHELAAVVTQPDRPAGRRRQLTPTPVGAWAADHRPDVPLLKPANINQPETTARVRAFDVGAEADRCGAWVVVAFGQKLSPVLLHDRFAINLHASRLPRWRGAAPINHAILAGDAQTGNSVITLADRMDAGLVLAQSQRPIEPSQTAGALHDLLAADGPDLILGVLDAFERGRLRAEAQDESLVTLAPKLSKSDGRLDPAADADAWRRTINGLSPWPGVTAAFRGEPLKLVRAAPSDEPTGGRPPGAIVDPAAGVVACAAGTVRLLEVQPAGKRAMDWAAFARGAQPSAGEALTEPA